VSDPHYYTAANDQDKRHNLPLDEGSLRGSSGRPQVPLAAWVIGAAGRKCDMQNAPWVVVEADDKQTIQREFGQGKIVDQFPSKDHSVFLVQSPELPTLPGTVLQGPIYGVGIFREEPRARTLAEHLAQI
jgi:hypothetical protein